MITKHTTSVLAVAVALFLGAITSFAAPASRESGAASMSPVGAMLTGEIESASSTSLTIADSQSGTSKTVSLTSSTVITLDGRSAKASDLKSGQSATVTVEQKEGLVVAVSVSARS